MLKRNIVIGLFTLFSSVGAHAMVSCIDTHHTYGGAHCNRICSGTNTPDTAYCWCATTTLGNTCRGCTDPSDWHCYRSYRSTDMSTELPQEWGALNEAADKVTSDDDLYPMSDSCKGTKK